MVRQTENSLLSQVLPDPLVLEDPLVPGFPVHPGKLAINYEDSLLTVLNMETTWRSTLGPGKPKPLSPGGPVAPLWPRSPFKVRKIFVSELKPEKRFTGRNRSVLTLDPGGPSGPWSPGPPRGP